MLVSEFTLTDNPGNTTTSLLRVVCHANDSVILGTWLQETDHRTIEDQVSIFLYLYINFNNFYFHKYSNKYFLALLSIVFELYFFNENSL
jgi:hypothetical protein